MQPATRANDLAREASACSWKTALALRQNAGQPFELLNLLNTAGAHAAAFDSQLAVCLQTSSLCASRPRVTLRS